MLGDNIRNARKKKRITQEQLAQEIGVQRSVISKYETGMIDPTFGQLAKICLSLGITLDDLIGIPPEEKEVLQDVAERVARDVHISKDDVMKCLIADKIQSIHIEREFAIESAADAALIEQYKEMSDEQLKAIYDESFRCLNRLGRIEAARRMDEMSEISKYHGD